VANDDALYAYAGIILRINLSNGQVKTEPTSRYAKDWIGSTGIATKILYDELRPWVTPYDPANKIVFGCGTLVGTPMPGACKMSASTLGPRTGGWASGLADSYVAGELKCAGYDIVVIEGRAAKPVYLWIEDDKIEIRDALHLWGKDTWQTLDSLRTELNDQSLHVLSIGPAGENLVRGACIIQDRARAFGRCGTGAVMGSKNLKAIVARGTRAVKVADPERFMQLVHDLRDRFRNAEGVEEMRRYGTLRLFPIKNTIYKNFQETSFPEEYARQIDPRRSVEKYEVARQNFPGCAIGCGRHLHITDGPYAGLKTESSQWETVTSVQARCAIEEPTFLFKANALCNQLGLDVDAAGGAIGWAMECYERGILTEKDTDGIQLNWGNADGVLKLIENMVYRRGFGDILAEGCARAADIVGRDSAYYAMHIKGQDQYEICRGNPVWALGATTSTRGGGHTTGSVDIRPSEVGKIKMLFKIPGVEDSSGYAGKAQMVAAMEVVHRMANSLGICHFNTVWGNLDFVGLPDMAAVYSAATGWPTSTADLQLAGERQLNLEKAFNLRFTSFGRRDDLPPARAMAEPIPTGRQAGWKMDAERYNHMLDEYYTLHGWDRNTSYPTRPALAAVGLDSVADDLEKIGKLGKV